ncbi:MAG: bifunctional diguanylate cyclase/phosphodiesterase [Firmicutes bacterium]|nr:bifunctional diguanylate cyclase/phosphodiesterase [Bacillota bacterium]
MNKKMLDRLRLILKICFILLLIGFLTFLIFPGLFFSSIKTYNAQSIRIIFLLLIMVLIFTKLYIKEKAKAITVTDTVTSGPNSEWFRAEAEKLFKRHGTKGYSIIQIDIDKFKFVNRRYGFSEGDKLLKYIHDMLNLNTHENELSARLLGDWFVMLINSSKRGDIISRVEKIINDISCYPDVSSKKFKVAVKCGIYILKAKKETVNGAIEKAIIAGRSVMSGYNSSYAFYDERLANSIIDAKQLEDRIGEAIKDGEFFVVFQPKYCLNNKEIYGAEALVRWNHPERGLMLPAEFIPIFEKNGFIVSLDRYVFEMVCKQIRWWLDNDYHIVPISVNVSQVNLYKTDFVKDFIGILGKHCIPSEYIELEFTESAIFENQIALHKIIKEFKSKGIALAIDDFGSGYSCLSLLGIMPFDTVKIDRRFLSGNFNTNSGRVVIKKIVELVNTIGMRVVIEGVETDEQADFLKNIGCNIVQGYLFSPPVTIECFNKLINNIAEKIQLL